ncbi:MAG: hypothetical protein US30_C0004G0082 [Candidatus Moranbacteria bacterium GW2011_GWF2_36_839]|nr:MAG: hypothetical protein US27_C0002G0085 [Candidatus Moranbacteria bacterium GW2011_GWF1_36_78]KKQ17338.1 MAG: hypothetical protein US30_C0004G0082 [Candidatus Moranbacteria bacterium GW2011_GWF2_36_839]HAT73818.1 hypothetical protein [Candidatus Moranbacteria bacterium]HBY11039.1 hypothetical protein [Candidatus Moranbacteria bacterium]
MTDEKNRDDVNLDSIFEGDIVETEKEIQQRKKGGKIEILKELGIKTLKFIGGFVVVIFIGYILFSDSSNNKDIQNTPSETEIKEIALKKELSGKYNAVIFDDNKYLFSKDLQENIDKNFFIEGWVHDIYKQDEKYFIKLNGYGYHGIFEISKGHIEYLGSGENEKGWKDNFFVIIKLANASKPLFEKNASIEKDSEDLLVYDEYSDDFLLEGEILAIQKID